MPGCRVLLLSLVVLSMGSNARRIRKRGLNHKDYEYPNHAQSTQHQKNDRCPPPPQMLPERACEVPGCRSDSECERHKRCCYNGCIYACLESVQPPPVLDWLVQPKPRWLGGNGWLLDGPEEVLQDLNVLMLKISSFFMKTPDVPCGLFPQLRPAAPLKMETSLFIAPLAMSATSSTPETPLLASLTGDSALSNVAILMDVS
ncbi:WAP four-disulfide core domain protein 1 isoform X2 [Takifugu rubripes]|uniref:WAP four-disulfide core domain protein 1 isoform X2 n=1 Tax=Takifugu rubripes TaxID=31033 RepID=UPI001145F268|nr:WAP four-disulfide core domain protein 1 isoform X2 [Takifugu rubripes]XP_029697748.1 WAP four-disulfide core domain protein 1 isoform X2 [Takifugu rubripes]